MIKKACLLVAGALVLLAPGAAAEATDEARTLTGKFFWNAGNRGPLEAVFVPTGRQSWDVAFHFEFRGKPHTYEGTAYGNLEDGVLEGEVQNENKRRTFRFSGTSEDGRFRGSHTEIVRGREQETGTLTLSQGGDESVQ